MIPLARYVLSDLAHGQRWVAPVLLYMAAVLILDTGSGPLLGTYGDTAACLLPVAIWLTWVSANAEDPIQAGVTAVAVGGPTRARLAKLAVAALATLPLCAFGVVVPLALGNYSGAGGVGRIGAGLAGHVLVAWSGTAIGAWAGRPVLQRAGWVFVLAAGAVLAEILIPHCPPTRQILDIFGADHPGHLARRLGTVTAETVALIAALVAGSLATARSLD